METDERLQRIESDIHEMKAAILPPPWERGHLARSSSHPLSGRVLPMRWWSCSG